MSFDEHPCRSELDENVSVSTPESGSITTLALPRKVEIDMIEEWLPRDPARSAEAMLIVSSVMFGLGLAAWAFASLQ